jgi:eukaryotic-like serine/threonine-protein kinase
VITSPPSSVPPPGNERLGTWLRGKYRVDSVLGVGGMAVVFAVTHRNGRRFALKMLYPEFSVRGDLRKRFLREGYIANAVGHPGAVAVLDDDVAEDGSAFLVMELLDGEGLDDIVDRHPQGLPPLAALSAAYQMLDTLVAAHAKNIVHRDIKPGNLFVIRSGEVKVLDFGIARLQDADSKTATRSGVTLGTPAFMAPEQAKGKAIDARADIYSVGATLFTLLSGRFVHEGENAQELMVKAATEPAPKLASIVPGVPAPVDEIVDRALAFHLADRWPSAVLMKAAVAHAVDVLTGGGIVAPSQLAPLLLPRSRVEEIYASLPSGPPVGAPSKTPASAPHVAMALALEATSPSAPTLASEVATPAAEENASPITAEPVATTKPSASAQVSTPPRSNRVRIGALVIIAAAIGAAILAFRATGRESASPARAAPAAAPEATTPTAASQVLPALAAAAAPSTATAALPAPVTTGAPSAGSQPRGSDRALPQRRTPSASDGGIRGASDVTSVDPWGTR